MSITNARAFFSEKVSGVIYFDKFLGGTMITAHITGLDRDNKIYVCVFENCKQYFPLISVDGRSDMRCFCNNIMPCQFGGKTIAILETKQGILEKPTTDNAVEIERSVVENAT